MPARRQSGGERANEGRPPRLRIRRADLARALAARMRIGHELLSGGLDLEDLKDKYYTWDEYNTTLLKNSFTTSEEADSYQALFIGWSDDPATQHRQVRDDIRSSIRRLESIKERLPLFEEEGSVRNATRETQDDTRRSNTEPAIFLVHGRDEGTKHGVARFVRAITGLEPIILAEQPALGQTVIESFERHASKVTYAIVLATGDDEGRLIGEEQLKPRARQNVVLELGWYAGKLGRQKVALLYQPGVELPSDMGGVLYVELDASEGWKMKLAREMRAAGLPVDMNKA
jgi:predicted nucleotide-binding protein